MNFWQEMKKLFDSAQGKPILCLAPMADVTDAAFRYIIAKYSKSDYVTYTEFVSADGLVLAPEAGRKKLLKDLEYSEIERPIVAQLFGSKPETMEKAAAMVAELGFDGIDINMGCPDKSIEKQGSGAALMKNPKLARELIVAAKLGVKNRIPISIKTRLGYNKDELETWLPELLTENPAAIIIHARTRKEMSKVPARWERIKRAVEIRDAIQTSPLTPLLDLGEGEHSLYTDNSRVSSFLPSPSQGEGLGMRSLIIGNGDVENVNDAIKKCQESGADGAMLGRAIFGNPWLFANLASVQQSSQIEHPERGEGYITTQERVRVLLEHINIFEQKFNGIKSFAIMKKHFKEYLKDPSLRDLRFKLMRTESAKEAQEVIREYLS